MVLATAGKEESDRRRDRHPIGRKDLCRLSFRKLTRFECSGRACPLGPQQRRRSNEAGYWFCSWYMGLRNFEHPEPSPDVRAEKSSRNPRPAGFKCLTSECVRYVPRVRDFVTHRHDLKPITGSVSADRKAGLSTSLNRWVSKIDFRPFFLWQFQTGHLLVLVVFLVTSFVALVANRH